MAQGSRESLGTGSRGGGVKTFSAMDDDGDNLHMEVMKDNNGRPVVAVTAESDEIGYEQTTHLTLDKVRDLHDWLRVVLRL